MDDETRSDMEHYTRLAQSIIDESVALVGRNIYDVVRERPRYSETELLENFLHDATQLAHSYVELLTWLMHRIDRNPGVLGTKRGNERFPRRPRM